MSIRVSLSSRRAEEGSAQTRWPSAILLVDNDPDKDTLPINQTPNKAKHSLSSVNNLTAARVMTRSASYECEEGNKALGGQEVVESILFIDLGLCTAWWCVVGTTFFFIPQTHKNIHSAKHFTLSILLEHSFARLYTCTLTQPGTHLPVWYFFRDRLGKLVTLVLIGIEIPSFFLSQQPLAGNADWLSSESTFSFSLPLSPPPPPSPPLSLPAHLHIHSLILFTEDPRHPQTIHSSAEDHFSNCLPTFLQHSAHWLSLVTYPYSWFEKAWRENFSWTLLLPACPMSLRSCGSLTSLSMALEKASAVGSHRKPVSPSATLSRGPPEFTAITGQQQYMASTGTIPKCSLLGVYSTAQLPRSSATFSESEGERRKVTKPSKWSCAASSLSSV